MALCCCLRCCVMRHPIHPLENILDVQDVDLDLGEDNLAHEDKHQEEEDEEREKMKAKVNLVPEGGGGDVIPEVKIAAGGILGSKPQQNGKIRKRTTFRETLALMSRTTTMTGADSAFPKMENPVGPFGTNTLREKAVVTPVHAAAVNGDKSSLSKLLLSSPRDIDAGDKFGRTPLMYCVLGDRMECAEMLIKAGADVNKQDIGGRTSLHWAAHKGNLRCLKMLLSKGANWKEKDSEGQTAMHLSTRHKSAKCLALLMKQLEPGEVDCQDKNNRTALHWAASYGNLEHVKMLIKQDSNIGIPDVEGKTPLHWAASSKDSQAGDCVTLILETTPSVIDWQDYDGRTALHLAVADGNEAVVKVLVSAENCNVSALDNMFRTPLHWAAVLGHSKICGMLLDSNADYQSSDSNGATPLHYAAQNNFEDTVEVFLSREGLKDEADTDGRSAFMWACSKGADDVIRCFIRHQVDMQQTDKNGGTGMHASALAGHASTVKLLLDSGAPLLHQVDLVKHTPLFRACEMGHTAVAQVLIDAGAKVDIVDQDGRSPLHWAALGGHAYICQMLIKFGVDPNVRDYTGRTSLQCAAYGGFVNCMSVLLEHKADCNAQDNEGMTALHWACSKGHLDSVKLLIESHAFPNHMEFTEDRYTSLDYALMEEHIEVAQYMIEQGGLSITGIQDIAALKIQAVFRGYRVRKTFLDRKKLLMKHEQLRKDAAKKKAEEEHKRKESERGTEPTESEKSEGACCTGLQGADSKHLNANNNSGETVTPSQEANEKKIEIIAEVNATSENTPPTAVAAPRRRKKTEELTGEQKRMIQRKAAKEAGTEERQRLATHRRQALAATVIQRAWREWVSRGRSSLVTAAEDSAHQRRGCGGEEEWTQQIAALTIQLAWRRYYRRKLLRSMKGTDKQVLHLWDPEVIAAKQRSLATQIYTHVLSSPSWLPQQKFSSRPTWFKFLPSPAALSYNFAVDQYHPEKRRNRSSWSYFQYSESSEDLSRMRLSDSFQPHHFSYNMYES